MTRAIAERLRAERLQCDVQRIAELASAGSLLGAQTSEGERQGVDQIARACRELLAGDVLGARDTMLALDVVQLPRLVHSSAMRVLVGAYEAVGDLQSSAFILESLLDDSMFDKDAVTLSQLGVDLFSSYVRLGEWDAAVDAAESVLARMGDGPGASSGEHLELVIALADLLVERGDVAEATRLCGPLLGVADSCGGEVPRGMAYWTASVAAAGAGDLPGSAAHARTARGQLADLVDVAELRELDLHLADVLARHGEAADLVEAEEVLSGVEEAAGAGLSDTDRGLMSLCRARMHLAGGRNAQALDFGVQAVACLAGSVAAPLCDACVVLGDTYRLLGMRESAEDCYLRASELLLTVQPSNATTNVWRDLETRMARFASM